MTPTRIQIVFEAVLGAVAAVCALGIAYCLGVMAKGFWDALWFVPPIEPDVPVAAIPRPRSETQVPTAIRR